MATNPPSGDGHRKDAVRRRSTIRLSDGLSGTPIQDVSWMSNRTVRYSRGQKREIINYPAGDVVLLGNKEGVDTDEEGCKW